MTADDFKVLEDKVAAIEKGADDAAASHAAKVADLSTQLASLQSAAATQPTADQVSALSARLDAVLAKLEALGKA